MALFIAVLLPLLWVGRRALLLSAILAGIGAGLFIDEVGKFLTTSNDYFFAPAAPIIYGSVLLLILLLVLIRRRRPIAYDTAQALVEGIGSAVDGHLTANDQERLIERAKDLPSRETAKVPLLADLVAMLESPDVRARLASDGAIASGAARRTLERVLPTRIERWLIIAALLWSVIAGMVSVAVLVVDRADLAGALQEAAAEAGRMELPTEPIWVLLLSLVGVSVGVMSLVGVVLLWRGRLKLGLDIAMAAALVNLVVGSLVAFYAVQLGALSSTLIGLALLGLIADQRIRLDRATVRPCRRALTPTPAELYAARRADRP